MRAVLLPVLLLAAAPVVGAPAPFVKGERRSDHGAALRPLQGKWSHVDWRGRFNSNAIWHVNHARVVIAGDRLRCYSATTHVPDRDATIRLDGNRDVTFRTERGVRLGIYKFNGETLIVCIAALGNPRPSAFGMENDGDEMITLSRTPPPR